jgi:outer membrane receptor for ferric coprogen and ferric-rhodotorulic acid
LFDEVTGDPILLPDLTQASRPVDGTETRGFELEVAGELRRGWNASLGWSRHVLEDADGAAVKSYIPRSVLRLFTTWKPASQPRLTIGGGLNWQSESSAFVGSPLGGTVLVQEPVTLLSVMARYQVSPKVSLQFNGENLLDEGFYVLDNYDNTYYGAPANYSLALNILF